MRMSSSSSELDAQIARLGSSQESLGEATADLFRRPLFNLVRTWSWKAALISAMLRAGTFFVTNLHAGKHKALEAMLVEAVFAIFVAGLMGAVSQRLRAAQPPWATFTFVCLAMPLLLLLTQTAVHHAAGTRYLGTGLIVSFCFASIASAFSWYAMRRGVLLGGADSTSLDHDLRKLPRVILDFILVIPRAILGEQYE
jgi:hypothetical protein